MPRKQIRAVEHLPLTNMDETEALNHDANNRTHSPMSSTSNSNSGSPHWKMKGEGEEEEDNEAVQDDKVTTQWDLLVYYARNSTMHGIPSIVGSELYRGRHIFWIIVVCVMAIFLGTVIYWQMSDYYSYPTVTSLNIHYVKENDFPAITVCDLNIFNAAMVKSLKDNFTAYHLTRLTEITGFYHRFSSRLLDKIKEPPAGQVSSDVNIQQMMDKFYALLNNPKYNTLYCSWGEYYWTLCPASSFRFTEMGLCSTIDVQKLLKKKPKNETDGEDEAPSVGNAMRGLTIYLDTVPSEIPYRIYQFNGFKIVLHDPDEEPLPLSSGFLVEGNTSVEVEISKNVKEGLPPPYKAFGSGICVETDSSSFENPLRRFPKYSKEVCEAECFINFAVTTCGGCRHFLHPGNESICQVDHLAECYRDAQANYYGGHVNKSADGRQCDCPMPCTQATYKASVTTTPFKSTEYFMDIQRRHNKFMQSSVAYVHFFYSDPVVSTMRQVAIYSTEGLLGNIGGQIGLFMGFSLVTVAEMLELIFLLATRGRKLDEHVKRHKEKEAVAQAALQAAVAAKNENTV